MDHRTHTTRSFRAGLARLAGRALGLTLAFAALGGCQNNSERDLIARERRMQEDQIYALQDYVTQYQQLLCRYRQENCSLKQQMAGGYAVEPRPSAPPPPRTRNSNQAPKSSPRFQPPRTPAKDQQERPSTPPEIEPPDVPPLKSTTSNNAESSDAPPVGEVEAEDGTTPQVLAASYDEPAASESAPDNSTSLEAAQGEAEFPGPSQPAASLSEASSQLAAEPVASASPATRLPASDILLSGEVVANDEGVGPRLMVDVVPFDASGRVESFVGGASLMLLARDGDGQPHNLGRWDYRPNQVRDAIDDHVSEPTMRFFIELPTESPVVGPTELWVRLVSPDGTRRLAHAIVELSQPGVFSSRAEKLWAAEEAVVAASYTEPAPPAIDVDATATDTVIDGTWAVAEPGKPANLPVEPHVDAGSGGWRTSSQPMPAVMATSSPAPPTRELENPLRPIERPPVAVNAEPAKRPAWSPERGGISQRRAATRPSWSATR